MTPVRDLSAWLSARDAGELLLAAVEAEGVQLLIANGTSANRHGIADLHDTETLLGYCPVDDAWADDQLHRETWVLLMVAETRGGGG